MKKFLLAPIVISLFASASFAVAQDMPPPATTEQVDPASLPVPQEQEAPPLPDAPPPPAPEASPTPPESMAPPPPPEAAPVPPPAPAAPPPAPTAATADYPICSKTVTDNCVNRSEVKKTRPRHK